MANEIPVHLPGLFEASTNLSAAADKFKALKVSGNLTLALSGDGELSYGILQNSPILGEAVTVMNKGVSKGRLGGTVTAGDKLAPNATGLLIVAASGKHPIGTALEGGVSGELVTLEVDPSLVPLA